LRLRSRSAGMCVVGWPGGAPSRAWAGPIRAGCRGYPGVVAADAALTGSRLKSDPASGAQRQLGSRRVCPPGLMRCGRTSAIPAQHAVQKVDSYCHLGRLRFVGLRAQRIRTSRFPQPISASTKAFQLYPTLLPTHAAYWAITCRRQSRCVGAVSGRLARHRTRTGWHDDCGIGVTGSDFAARGRPGCMRHGQ
jgi:hypothetical protein